MSDTTDKTDDPGDTDRTGITGDKKTVDEECTWCSCGGHRYKTGRAYWIAVGAIAAVILALYAVSVFM
jgi:hypothetical protein